MYKLWSILVVFALTAPVLVWADPKTPLGPQDGNNNTPPDAQPVITDPLNAGTVQEIADRIINFLLTLAAPIAVIMTIYAGFLFITAGDNQDRVKTARRTLLYVVIGVMILILSKGVVSFVSSFL